MYLFDASSIVNLVKKGVVRVLAEGETLDLALYESVNAIWKEHVLLGKLDEDTAKRLVSIISRLFNVVSIASVKGAEEEVFSLASREKITVYDAAYLYTALKKGLILVTDDRKFRSKASRYVKTATSTEIAERYTA